MSKIIEKIIEPSKINVGSIFKVKIRVIRYATYEELKVKTVNYLKDFSIADLKGEGR